MFKAIVNFIYGKKQREIDELTRRVDELSESVKKASDVINTLTKQNQSLNDQLKLKELEIDLMKFEKAIS